VSDPVFVALIGVVVGLIVFLSGLFIGWRFGRESLHMPPFSFPQGNDGQPQDVVVDERDPWDEAIDKRILQ